MSTPQEPLQVGDTVEITQDNRSWLIGRRGIIDEITGDTAHVKFAENIGRGKAAVCFLANLKKVEALQ